MKTELETPHLQISYTPRHSIFKFYIYWLIGIVLCVVSFGFLYPWFRVFSNRYFMSGFSVNQKPLRYQGAGSDTLVFFLKTNLLFILIYASWYCVYILCDTLPILFIPNIIIHCIVAVLNYHYAVIRLKAYQLSHMVLDEPFQWKGSKWHYAKQRTRLFFLSLISLGYFYPDYLLFHYSYLIQNLHLNDQRFELSFSATKWDSTFFDHTAKSFFSFGFYKLYAELKLLLMLVSHIRWGCYDFIINDKASKPSVSGLIISIVNLLTFGLFYPLYLNYKFNLLFSLRESAFLKAR